MQLVQREKLVQLDQPDLQAPRELLEKWVKQVQLDTLARPELQESQVLQEPLELQELPVQQE